jgi:hypothetical protein
MGGEQLNRRLAAILAADVVSYARLIPFGNRWGQTSCCGLRMIPTSTPFAITHAIRSYSSLPSGTQITTFA